MAGRLPASLVTAAVCRGTQSVAKSKDSRVFNRRRVRVHLYSRRAINGREHLVQLRCRRPPLELGMERIDLLQQHQHGTAHRPPLRLGSVR